MKRIFPLIFCFLSFTSFAQKTIRSSYPQNYFKSPIDIPIFLAGNFGECRPGHFHSGLDIKTNSEENHHVYAAADGYISRIKMEKDGFGHALYVTHANGYTTLYAHLSHFVPKIQEYLEEQQYKQEKWNLDIQLDPSQFPVKQGEQIAWSGNTGGSTAPHLHFEIRDNRTEHPLNAELFGLPLIDNTPPVPHEIGIYDLNKSIYEQTAPILSLQKNGGVYKTRNDTITTHSNAVGIGLNVDDYMDGSTNTLAFYSARLYLDDSLQSEIILDDIGYEETRYINAYADYKTKEEQKKWLQCFFKLQGNKLGHIYHHLNNSNGALLLTKNKLSKVRIDITDDKGNSSNVSFYLKYEEGLEQLRPGGCTTFKASEMNRFQNRDVQFSLDDKTLYDDICFQFERKQASEGYSDILMLHHSFVPVHHFFSLQVKPNKTIPLELKSKMVLKYTDGTDTSGKAAHLSEQGWYEASVRYFGTYWLIADTQAPNIESTISNGDDLSGAKQILFTVKDAETSVKNYRGEIDGKWVCFEEHNDQFFYNFDSHCTKGEHELVFTATDENNNSQTVRFTFTR